MCRYEQTTLPPHPAAAGHARRWLTDLLIQWDLADAADDLRVVVSELVSNAVLHARTALDVALSIAEGVLELSVSDRDPRSPRPRPQRADDSATSGRGLVLVEALSDDWGISQRMDGKDVWFRVAAPAGWRYAQACVCTEAARGAHRRAASGRRVAVMNPQALPGSD